MAAALRRNPRFPLARLPSATFSAAASPELATPPPPPSPESETPPAADTATPGADKLLSALRSAIRSESDPDRIATLFQSSAHIRRFHADRALYQLSVQKLARSRRPDLIERLLSDPSAPQSEGFLTRVISLYANAGMIDHAVRSFDRAAAAGSPPLTDRSLCALLTAFLKTAHYDRVVESFNRVPADLSITPGLVAHNILIQALCKLGDVDAARNVFVKMTDNDLNPNIVSYNTVLEGYLSTEDDTKFNEILKEISDKGLVPNVVTYNCRIAAFARKKEMFKAEELLDVMDSKEVPPSRGTFKSVIKGFCKEGDMDSAVRVFKRMQVTRRKKNRNDLVPDADTYNMLIGGLNKKGAFGFASKFCKECLAKKMIPPFKLVKELAEGLKENSKVDEAKDIVERMRGTLNAGSVDAWKKIENELSLEGAVDSQENAVDSSKN